MKKVVLIIYVFFVLNVLYSQNIQKSDSILNLKGEICFSFIEQNKTKINQISRIVSIDNVKENGKVFCYANKEEFNNFLKLNILWQLEPHTSDISFDLKMISKEEISSKTILDWDTYPTYDAYQTLMSQFQTTYPTLCRIDTILSSTPGGRKILVAKITDNVNIYEDEPQFFYTSTMHGDETTGFVLMLRMIDYLLRNYNSDNRIKNLVDNIEIYINPLANPDGTYAGGNNSVAGATRSNANNYDLNRNFPDPVAGLYPNGTRQPETQAFMNFAINKNFVMSANIHGGVEVLNYPWDCKSQLNTDDQWWQFVAKEYADSAHKMANNNGYFTNPYTSGITNGFAWYQALGGRQDYLNYWHHCREHTLEISTTKNPSASTLPTYWNYNYLSLLNYMQEVLYGFRGIVTDSISNQPIKAKITVLNHDLDSTEVYSNLPIGNYHRPIKAGSWSLKFDSPGYISKTFSNLDINDKTSYRLDVKLLKADNNIENYTLLDNIFIKPNPSNSVIIVEMPYIKTDASIVVYNSNGSIIYTSKIHNQDKIQINISNYNAGLYFLKLTSKDESKILKFNKIN